MHTTNSEPFALRARQASNAEQSAAIRHRRDGLTANLSAMEEQATAPSTAAAEAQAAMAVALLANDSQAIAQARSRVVEAAQLATQAGATRMEIEALKGAVTTLDAELAHLAEQAVALKCEEEALLLARLDTEANSLQTALAEQGFALLAEYAKASVLSTVAESAGAAPGRYGPAALQSLDLVNLGIDRMNRLRVVIQPADVFAGVRAGMLAKLRTEGWAV